MKRNSLFYLIIPFLFLLSTNVFSQSKFTISGSVKDKNTGESLIGATIRIAEIPGTGTITNQYGFYSLTIPSGDYTVLYNYIGYAQQSRKLKLDKNTQIDIVLDESSQHLQEIVISSSREDDNVTNPQTGVQKIDMKEINKIPVLMGERDIIKSIQLMPGIKSAGDGNSGFYVRGGGADQNLILLDDALVYNAAHLLGFFSTFNSDAIKDATIYKSGMPSEYGGRLSSVLDIKMNDGNNQDYHVNGGVGLISARLNVEGPIQKEKSSFLISGRRTYADVFLPLSGDEDIMGSQLYFYDLNAKANYVISDKDKIYLSGYFGRDKLGYQDLFGMDWGNATGTLRWNHVVSPRLFSNTSLIISDYNYNLDITMNDTEIGILSKIQDRGIKQEFQFFPNPKNTLKFGFNSTYHTIMPGEISISGPAGLNVQPVQKRYSWENGLYFSNNWQAFHNLDLIYGLRLTTFSILGEGDFYTLNEDRDVVGVQNYKEGQFVKTYFNLEPRFSAAYKISRTSSIKGSFARTTQNMHLISNSTTSSPTDRWIPSSNNIKPQIADQVSLGYFRNFKDNRYEFSLETYYKGMQNQIDYKDGADITISNNVETELLTGSGRAYGMEFFLKKKYGKLNGWIGYTLSRTEIQIEGINKNQWYPARQDRTHDIQLVGIYELNDKWTFSSTFVYNTGNAVTFPSGKYAVDDKVVFYYTERNGYRMPAYHRLDLGATWKLKDNKKFSSELVFSIYNVYGRENPFIINFRQNAVNPDMTEAYQVALFKMIPSISYNFKF